MAIVIEDQETIEQIERLAADLQVSPREVVRAAVAEKAIQRRTNDVIDAATVARRKAAIREAQEWFRQHGNKDLRTADEIIGYNEHGHFG